jgi:hypothetical protein
MFTRPLAFILPSPPIPPVLPTTSTPTLLFPCSNFPTYDFCRWLESTSSLREETASLTEENRWSDRSFSLVHQEGEQHWHNKRNAAPAPDTRKWKQWVRVVIFAWTKMRTTAMNVTSPKARLLFSLDLRSVFSSAINMSRLSIWALSSVLYVLT